MSVTEDNLYNTSLFVADLHHDVTEMTLAKLFGENTISSSKVVRDTTTKKSYGYAYVNFYSHEDAERVLKDFNQKTCLGKPMRIMWAERNPDKRKDNKANLFIKNIDTSVDAKTIYDAFGTFGTILSFKICTDENGHSLGYGFIHFANASDAEEVIKKVHGVPFKGKKVSVSHLIPRSMRSPPKPSRYNNLFFKNFECSPEVVELEFKKHGEIISFFIPIDENNTPKLFGFVCFKDPEAAIKASNELNGKNLFGQLPFYCVKALKKREREAQLNKQRSEKRWEIHVQTKDKNLYVKNFSENVTDEILKQWFSEYGNVTSCKVMLDNDNKSKLFGFVCFENDIDAKNALEAYNGKVVDGKSLYVSFSQTREERRYHFAKQYNSMRMNNQNNVRTDINMGGLINPRNMPMVPQMNGLPMHANDRRVPQHPGGLIAIPAHGQVNQQNRSNIISQYGVNQGYQGMPTNQIKPRNNQTFQKSINRRGGSENFNERKTRNNKQGAFVDNDETFHEKSDLRNVITSVASSFVPIGAVDNFVGLVLSSGDLRSHMETGDELNKYLRAFYEKVSMNL